MDHFVRFINLPVTIRGLTVPDENGNFNIYINKNLSYRMQIETYFHEITHIKNDDFNNHESIVILEEKAKYGT